MNHNCLIDMVFIFGILLEFHASLGFEDDSVWGGGRQTPACQQDRYGGQNDQHPANDDRKRSDRIEKLLSLFVLSGGDSCKKCWKTTRKKV
jgi:hypothetical protein